MATTLGLDVRDSSELTAIGATTEQAAAMAAGLRAAVAAAADERGPAA